MASIFRKHGKWYVKVKQVDGRWVPQPTTATTKSEAKGLALKVVPCKKQKGCAENACGR